MACFLNFLRQLKKIVNPTKPAPQSHQRELLTSHCKSLSGSRRHKIYCISFCNELDCATARCLEAHSIAINRPILVPHQARSSCRLERIKERVSAVVGKLRQFIGNWVRKVNSPGIRACDNTCVFPDKSWVWLSYYVTRRRCFIGCACYGAGRTRGLTSAQKDDDHREQQKPQIYVPHVQFFLLSLESSLALPFLKLRSGTIHSVCSTTEGPAVRSGGGEIRTNDHELSSPTAHR